MKLVRSPHAHARIRSIDAADGAGGARGARGPHPRGRAGTSITPAAATSTTTDDPDDTLLLDRVVRFAGQRVAAVVADTVAAAERAAGLVGVDYELLPAVFDAEAAMAPGAPLVHADKGPEARIADPGETWPARCTAEIGDVDGGVRRRPRSTRRRSRPIACSTSTWRPTRRSPGSTTTGGLVVRTSSQTPFLTRDALCRLFELPPRPRPRVHRPGGRRLRRQAGDADRGHRRAGGAALRPAGAAGAHPRGGVHRHHHPPRDARSRVKVGRRRGRHG